MSSNSGIISPIKAAIQGKKGSGAQIVQIVKLPQAVATSAQNSTKAYRLEGQVTGQNPKDNTVQIQTAKGAIDVKVKANQQPPLGQKIEIEIPNTRQPREASIRADNPSVRRNSRTAPAQQQPSQQAPQQTPIENSATNVATRLSIKPESIRTPPPTNQPAVNNAVPDQTTQQQPQQAATNQDPRNLLQTVRNIANQLVPSTLQNVLTPPKESIAPQTTSAETVINTTTRNISADSLVRLLAIAPAQAQNIAKEFIQTLPQPINNIINKSVFLNNALKIQNTNNVTPQIQTVPALLTQSNPQTILNNLTAPVQPQATTQQTTFLQTPTLNTNQPLTSTQTLPVNSTVPVTRSAQANTVQNATLIPTSPIAFDTSNPAQSTSKPIGQLDIQIIKIIPPEVSLKAPINNTLPQPSPIPAATKFSPPILGTNNAVSLNAQVTGFTPQGLPLVTVQGLGGRLPQSFILQQTNLNLQLGNQLQIVPQNTVAVPSRISPVALQTLNNPLLQGFQWPALNDLYTTLQQLNPQTASSLSRTLPNAGNPSQMGAAAMVFIAAVKSGNFENLLGDKKMDLLQQVGKSGLLKSMTLDSARAGAPEPAVQSDWRAVPLPMFWEGEIHKITLYARHEQFNDGQENQNENGQTRFIFDLNLTRMGDVQIDGLIKDKRLDLILRTQNAFSEPMQQAMRQSYTGALGQTELTGELNFQGSTNNWVHVLEKEENLGLKI